MLRTLSVILFLACPESSLPANDPSRIVIMSVEDPNNYDAVNSMQKFADHELAAMGHTVVHLQGNQPKPTRFDGLPDALHDADLLILFARRCTLPKAQLDAIRAHLNAGRPLLGIRTANHAFLPLASEPVTDPNLATWPEFTPDVLGGQNTGYETEGLPYSVTRHPEAPVDSPLLTDVHPEAITGHISLYKVLPLADDVTPLLVGTARSQTPPQPLAWTRLHGPRKARIFYTSLGAPEDLAQPDVRRLLVNAVHWTLRK